MMRLHTVLLVVVATLLLMPNEGHAMNGFQSFPAFRNPFSSNRMQCPAPNVVLQCLRNTKNWSMSPADDGSVMVHMLNKCFDGETLDKVAISGVEEHCTSILNVADGQKMASVTISTDRSADLFACERVLSFYVFDDTFKSQFSFGRRLDLPATNCATTRKARNRMCVYENVTIKLPDVMCTSDAGAVLANKVRQASVCDLPHSDTSTAVDSQSVATDCTAECMENQTGYCAVGHCVCVADPCNTTNCDDMSTTCQSFKCNTEKDSCEAETPASQNTPCTAEGCTAETCTCDGSGNCGQPPITAQRVVTAGTKTSKIVIVGGGPAGIHFAKRLKDEGYAASDITILESQNHLGGKSFTYFLPEQPHVRHELGTCYMHLGYQPVRDLLKEYGLADSEVGLGDVYLAKEKNGQLRKVWELTGESVYSRGDNLGQDFDDWLLSEADKREVEKFYGKNKPSVATRLSNIMAAAKRKPQAFLKGLRAVRDYSGVTVTSDIFGISPQMGSMSDNEVVKKLNRVESGLFAILGNALDTAASERAAKRTGGVGDRDADFLDNPRNEMDGAGFVAAGLNLVLQIGSYVDEHEALFGKFDYGLPPRPSDDKLAEINMSFGEWLDSKGFYALMPLFVYSQAAQGYGSLEKVPAFYGLWWNHPGYIRATVPVPRWVLNIAKYLINDVGVTLPRFILAPIGSLIRFVGARSRKVRDSDAPAGQAVLKSGFSQLWMNIVEKEELDVKLNCAVTNIDRSGATPVVTYKDVATNEEVSITAEEYVVLAVPLKPAMQGVSAYTKPGLEMSQPVVDEVTRMDPLFTPTQEEEDVLGALESYTLKTVLFTADPFPEPSPIYPGEVWAHALQAYAGRVRYLTNSELSTLGTESPGQTGYVTYQALDEPPNEVNDADLKAKFAEDVAAIGLTNVDIVVEKPWYYFPHFPQEAVQAGAPWKLFDLQGKQGMLFSGSSCSFESVLDVMAYNDLLIDKFFTSKGDKSSGSASNP